jgi:hypothetical protein
VSGKTGKYRRRRSAAAGRPPDGEVVVLGAGDLGHLPLPTRKSAEVLGFVPDGDVDPLMYDRPYWAAPAGDAAQRPYALLVEALAMAPSPCARSPCAPGSGWRSSGRGTACSCSTHCAGRRRSAIPAT